MSTKSEAGSEADSTTPFVMDVHAHALPLPLLEVLERNGLADLSGRADLRLGLDPALCGLPPGAQIPLPTEQYDLTERLAAMTASGVDTQAVSAPPFLFASDSPDERLAMDVARRSNDALAEFVAGGDGRLAGLATVPVGLAGAAEELRRCQDELGFVGVTAGTFGAGRELDDPVNEDLWAELERRQTFVLLHPSKVSSPPRLASYHLVQLLGYPVETALATARLVFGGVLDRYDVVLCLAHGGGCLPAVGPRLDLGWRRKEVARVSTEPPTHYLDRLYYDTAVFDRVALRRLVEDMGSGQVLLGTDAPFDLADREPLASVRDLGLAEDDRHAILGGNAARLLGVDPTRSPAPIGAGPEDSEAWSG